ncbi:MerR family transcriptional regulator [Roseospirillum parvum]|uniref:DNA-binding transcriptional regulator, MerR family n=1 Tax=Roseospirillum parvum TaxID=83401 RepID=A0A1G8CVN0_9PROT|nr:helix-turn-helix domain-containing protein [Roseospirillum parvum]SDH49597.1 DNA-binding transcriptional regulator, MerR family [Roseospirillum parvum]
MPASHADYSIGQAARVAGVKVPTIRYYEAQGLLTPPPRTEGNQRRYGAAEVARLAFIRHARELGFPLPAIRDLLSLSDHPDQSCDAADAIARAQLAEVERRLENLTALKSELERMVDQCQGGRIANCRVIEVLANHDQCLAETHNPVT